MQASQPALDNRVSYNNGLAGIEAKLSQDFITLCFYGSERESTTRWHAAFLNS
jgi:hypothetical protein